MVVVRRICRHYPKMVEMFVLLIVGEVFHDLSAVNDTLEALKKEVK
jgi:hypothetical protein